MNKFLLTMLCIGAMVASSACSDNDEPVFENIPQKDIVLSRTEQELVDGQTEFAYKVLASAIENSQPGENVVLSPYALSGVLSMTANAAEGEVARDIFNALGWNGPEDMKTMNEFYQRLTSELLAADKLVEFSVANSAWLNPDFVFNKSFSDIVSNYYNAGVFYADFSSNAGINQLNTWISNATNGLIQSLPGIDKSTDFALAGANYFKGQWQTPFQTVKSKKYKFNNATTYKSDIDMLESYEIHTAYSYEDFSLTQIPYGNGSFRMTLILPDKGVKTAQIASKLTGRSIKEAIDNYETRGACIIYLPKFKVKYSNQSMMDVLNKMGMTVAMNPKTAVLNNLADAPMKIGKLTHNVIIEVNEKGVEAASTSDEIGSLGAPITSELIFDRPFIFIIDEVSTGAVLFAGAINTL